MTGLKRRGVCVVKTGRIGRAFVCPRILFEWSQVIAVAEDLVEIGGEEGGHAAGALILRNVPAFVGEHARIDLESASQQDPVTSGDPDRLGTEHAVWLLCGA